MKGIVILGALIAFVVMAAFMIAVAPTTAATAYSENDMTTIIAISSAAPEVTDPDRTAAIDNFEKSAMVNGELWYIFDGTRTHDGRGAQVFTIATKDAPSGGLTTPLAAAPLGVVLTI